jgi:xanthine dehydrogenase accessory factor
VLRAPVTGVLESHADIGDLLVDGQIVAAVGGQPVRAPFAGVLRGLVHAGASVAAGLKVGDVDPRGQREHCFTISDKSLAVAGGVLEAIFAWRNGATA